MRWYGVESQVPARTPVNSSLKTLSLRHCGAGPSSTSAGSELDGLKFASARSGVMPGWFASSAAAAQNTNSAARCGLDAKGRAAGDDGAFAAAQHQRRGVGSDQAERALHDDDRLGVGKVRDIDFTDEADTAGAHRARPFPGDFSVARKGIGRAEGGPAERGRWRCAIGAVQQQG